MRSFDQRGRGSCGRLVAAPMVDHPKDVCAFAADAPGFFTGRAAVTPRNPHAAIAAAARLPDVRLIRFGPESTHGSLREADPLRDPTLTAIDRFLDERTPAR